MAQAKSFHEQYTEADLDSDETGLFLPVRHELGRKFPIVAIYGAGEGFPYRQLVGGNPIDINDPDEIRIYGINQWPVHVRVIA
jgi:hypothetical protein